MTEVVSTHAGGKQLQQSYLSTNIQFTYKTNPDEVIPTYKHDYKLHCQKKEEPICEPIPAKVEHKDLRYLNELQTETMVSYKAHLNIKRFPQTPRWTTLNTNFKMPTSAGEDAFVTTNNAFRCQEYHPPQPHRASSGPSVLQKLGHVEKLPPSTHQESYTPPKGSTKQTTLAPDPRISAITGDGLPRSYETQYNKTFKETPFTKAPPVVKHSSAVVIGDKERIVERQTTHSASFTRPSVFSPSEIKLQPKFSLGHTSTPSWSCTSSETFSHHKPDPVVLVHKDENFSSVPKGDLDPGRVQKRMSSTTNHCSFTNMKPLQRPGTDPGLITKSNVHFSPASLYGSYFCTSNKEAFNTKQDTQPPKPATFPPSYILTGPEYGPNLTTVQTDYYPLPSCKVPPSRSLQTTNIKFPVSDQLYSTTHKVEYTPKSTTTPHCAKSQLICNFNIQ